MRSKPVPIKVPSSTQHSKMDSDDADELIIHSGGTLNNITWSGDEMGFGDQENVSGGNIELQLLNNQVKQQRLMTVVLQKKLLNFNMTQKQKYRQNVLEKEKRKQIAQESAVKEAKSMRMPKNAKNEIVLPNQPKSLDRYRESPSGMFSNRKQQIEFRLESMQAQRNEKPATTLLNDKFPEHTEQTRQSRTLSRNPEQINRVKSDGSLRKKKQIRSKRRDVVTDKDPIVREKSTTYSCEDCNKAFPRKDNLIEHSRIHSGEKPFKCGECGSSFRRKITLTVHKRIHSGEKPFKCGECGTFFRFRSNLTVHKRVHTGEKPFECRICNVAFNQKPNLSRHLLIHTNDKPFICDICKQSFRRKDTLSDHMNIHRRNRLYKYNVCQKAFRQTVYAETTLRTK